MSKSSAPKPSTTTTADEFAVLDEPEAPVVAEPEAPPAPEPPTPEELAQEAKEVVVGSSTPVQPEAYRVLNAKRVCIQGSIIMLKPGRVMRVDHYPAGTIEHLQRGGVEFERIA